MTFACRLLRGRLAMRLAAAPGFAIMALQATRVSWRWVVGFALFGWAAKCVVFEWDGPDVSADERVSLGALAETDLQLASRCQRVRIGFALVRIESKNRSSPFADVGYRFASGLTGAPPPAGWIRINGGEKREIHYVERNGKQGHRGPVGSPTGLLGQNLRSWHRRPARGARYAAARLVACAAPRP